jgi:hypothetical protein
MLAHAGHEASEDIDRPVHEHGLRLLSFRRFGEKLAQRTRRPEHRLNGIMASCHETHRDVELNL